MNKKFACCLLHIALLVFFHRHRSMPLLIPVISWIKCRIIPRLKNNWMVLLLTGKEILMQSKPALDKMYKDYEAEQVMLSDDLKKKRRISFF